MKKKKNNKEVKSIKTERECTKIIFFQLEM